MAKCYVCHEDIFLKVHEEVINGKKRKVCGKCKDVVCAICGKTKKKDDIMKWSYEKHPDTGEYVTIGCCCTFVAGKMDMFKLYSEKYQNMKKNDPETLNKIMAHSEQQRKNRASVLANSQEADKLIDRWANKVQKVKQKTGKGRA